MSPHPSPIAEPLAALCATRRRTLERVVGLDQARIDFRPSGRWSVGQVLDHLRLSEELYRGEVDRLVALARDGRPAFVRRSLREVDVGLAPIPGPVLALFDLPLSIATAFLPWAIRERLVLSRWLSVRNPRVADPTPGRPLAHLVSELETGLASTVELFERNADLDFYRMFHQHALVGLLTPIQILRFLDAHERRHQAQIGDALAASSPG